MIKNHRPTVPCKNGYTSLSISALPGCLTHIQIPKVQTLFLEKHFKIPKLSLFNNLKVESNYEVISQPALLVLTF